MVKVRRALISVYDKTGIVEFAKGLSDLGIEIISTGGTKTALQDAGVPVRYVSELTGFPEILEGRVKTLHPKIHAGILYKRDKEDHVAELERLGIGSIDMVVVNLYPFEATVSKPGVDLETALENIDIGGPTMIRAAAKNHPHVVVVVNPKRYEEILGHLANGDNSIPPGISLKLAVEAFEHTARYDVLISKYLGSIQTEDAQTEAAGGETGRSFPEHLLMAFDKRSDLRYGENPHQAACVYVSADAGFAGGAPRGLLGARQLLGPELSFNNIGDASAALEALSEFDEPCAVAVKHANPCGVGIGKTIAQAYERAYLGDPVSIFGGIVALNRPVDKGLAEKLAETFLEIIIAPSFEEDALQVLASKKKLRVLAMDSSSGRGTGHNRRALDYKFIDDGILVQEADRATWDMELVSNTNLVKVVTKASPDGLWEDLMLALRVVKHVKSNAIVVAAQGGTIGIGAGQMSRISAARLALEAGGEKCRGAVMASDAFFPFSDVVELAAKSGIAAIIQPGGSIRDQESIEAADRAGIAMVFTGVRHFKH